MKRILFSLITFCSVACFGQYPITGVNISMPANTVNSATFMAPVIINAQTNLDRNHRVNGFVMESRIMVSFKNVEPDFVSICK